jgi:hypothetical protein
MEFRQTLRLTQSLGLLFLLATTGCLENQKKASVSPYSAPETFEERRKILDELIEDISVSRTDISPLAGKWEIMNVIRTPISAISDQEAFELLGTRVVYSKNRAVLVDHACSKTGYKTRIEAFADYFRDFGLSADQLRIKTDLFEVVKLTCNRLEWNVPGAEVIPVERDRLLIIWKGTVYVLWR